MYIVDDPFTALAFVYFYDYGTDVCGMLIAVLRRGSFIEQCYASYAGIMHSAAFMFSLQQLAWRDRVSVSQPSNIRKGLGKLFAPSSPSLTSRV